jgi:hypothetical protein
MTAARGLEPREVSPSPPRAADRGLHIGVGEAQPPFRHRIDIRRLQGRMARTAQIIVAKLVAHDPENVFGARHVLHFGDSEGFYGAILRRK